MSMKDWMPDRTFWIGSVVISVILGWIGGVPWWSMWLFWFVAFPAMLWIVGWITGDHTIKGEKKWGGYRRP